MIWALRAVFVVCFTASSLSLPAGTFVWDGAAGAGNSRWDMRFNWDTNTVPPSDGTAILEFGGTSELLNSTHGNWDILTLRFNNTAGSFVLIGPGDSLTVQNGIINDDNSNQTISINTIALGGSQTIQTTSTGNLTINSLVGIGGSAVTFDAAASTNISLTAEVSGTGSLTKTGLGTTTLSGSNTYTGATSINAGVLNIQNNTGLGTTATGTTVSSGAALELQGSIAVGAEALTLNGSGVGNNGALRNISGTNSWGGTVTLASASKLQSDAGTLTVSGGVTGTQNLTLDGAGAIALSGAITTGTGTLTKTGSGTATLSGSSANTFTGTTTVSAGTLALAKTSGTNAVGSGNIVINGGTLLLGTSNQIPNTTNMTLATGTFDTGGRSETLGTLTLTANSTLELGGGASIINYANSSGVAWTGGLLTIQGWSGNASGGGTDQLYFANSTAGLTSGQLLQIQFLNPDGLSAGTYGAQILASGEVVPGSSIPEAGTWIAALLLSAFALRRQRSSPRISGYVVPQIS